MKKLIALMLVVVLLLCLNVYIYADSPDGGIKIDGSFDDWADKPAISDPKHDVKETSLDFLNLGYFSDNDYLYLHVERLSARKSEPWELSVVMVNGLVGEKLPQYPYGDSDPIYAPQFDIKSYSIDNNSSSGTVVEVVFEGRSLESTFSADDNNKEIEFRIPLKEVGLEGINKEIEFMLKSTTGDKREEIDWMPDGSTIMVTTGPTFYQMSTILLFSAVSFTAYRIYRRKTKLELSK